MKVFVDTSAFIAVLSADDRFHAQAKTIWQRELTSDTHLVTSNYVVLETTEILQNRIGLDAVRTFDGVMLPPIEVRWVDGPMHNAAMSAVLAAQRRSLSLVDCVSFEVIKETATDYCFTFDPHFSEQGFIILS